MKFFVIILFIIVVNGMKNGSPVDQDEFKYIVAVTRWISYLCSGIIIDETHVLTAAHMITHVPLNDLGIIGGRQSLVPMSSYKISVKKVHIHPDFTVQNVGLDDIYYAHDIALLMLDEPIRPKPVFAPMSPKNLQFDKNYCSICIIVSWQVPQDRRRHVFLTWELIKFMDNDRYQQYSNYLGENQYFFGDFFGNADINNKDIGSPIVCGNIVKGIISKGEQKNIPGKPAIMTSMAPYLGFIQEIIRNKS